MSQKAIKKKTTEHLKHVVRIPVKPLQNRSNRKEPEIAISLPEKSFPLNKFIALPPGLRPKTANQNSESSSPRRTTPVKAVAVPVGTSSTDSRAHIYMVSRPEGSTHTVTNGVYTTDISPYQPLHKSTDHQLNGHRPKSGTDEEPYATSTPRTSRRESQKRGYHSAQNSPRGSTENSPLRPTPNGSISSVGSDSSGRKRIYKKRSCSAPPDNRHHRGVVDTDFMLNKWTDCDTIPGLTKTYHSVQDGVVIESENWTRAKIGQSHQVYRTNSVASGHSGAGSVTSSNTYSTASPQHSISNLEFTDVCNLNPDSSVESYSVSANGLDFIRSDTVRGDYAGVNTREEFSDQGSRYSNGGVYKTSSTTTPPSHKFVRSWSDLNVDKIGMADRIPGQTAQPRTYAVNGAPQTGLVIYQPGKKEKIYVNDQHGPVSNRDRNFEFLTMGRKTGTLVQSKMKFSSMPTLTMDSKGDKKLMKLLKKQEKEEKKRKEKEEKKRAKEEKKRIKMEKKIATKTLPRNFAYQNGHTSITSPGMANMFKRPGLSMTAVSIDFEDGPSTGKTQSSSPPTEAPPPPPGPSSRTMSLYASAPDLQRIEQIYGATLRGVPKEFSKPITATPTSDYSPRSVVLQRAAEGYGFVLRGAKSQLKPNGELDFRPTPEFPALQYLDSVDPRSVSDKAGLRAGDFILEINGENVVRASHDRVVHLIRGTGDTLAMKVVTVKPSGRSQDWFIQQDKSLTMPNRKKKAPAPAPPQRNPRTSLSISRSEGGSLSEELAVLESFDQTILERKMSEEKKTASIRSRTAAKRVSCVELENIGVQSQLERSKSTPDLLDAKTRDAIYATPQVPGSTANGSAVNYRPRAAPPAPPADSGSPKKPAPKPPSEVVTINTTKKPTQYASVTVHVNKKDNPDSPYESSFRPGDSAKMTDDPSLKEVEKDEKQNVSFAEDKVLDHAASFLKKHPNAKLLITTEAQKKVKNRNSGVFEPEPDYDDDSGEDKQASANKIPDKRQSVTVISVGQKKQVPPSPTRASPQMVQSNRYKIQSTIPSDEPPRQTYKAQGMVIPPKPDGPAPSPPNQSPRQQIPKFAAPAPPVAKASPMSESNPPSRSQTPPPDFPNEPSVEDDFSYSGPPSVPAPPPPPPPPPAAPPAAPPAPSLEQLSKEKTTTQTELTSRIPIHSIAAAVAKRQERIEKDGININTSAEKPKPSAPKNETQAAILAAVARRREKLETQSETRVVDVIEQRLQKTKKLQAAKFQISSAKTSPRRDSDVKSNDIVQKKPNVVQSSVARNDNDKKTVPSVQPEKEKVKATATEVSFKVKPVGAKSQASVTELKSKFTNVNSSTSNTNGTSNTKTTSVKKQESLKLKTEPLEKTIASEINATSETQKPQEQSNKTNGQSDFLALAEKKRREYLQRKQKSADQKSPPGSKSSSVSGTPERKPAHQNKTSPPISAKPKSSNSSVGAKTEDYTEFQSPRGLVKVKTVSAVNGEAGKDSSRSYTNVPPPPPGFRDGGHVDNTVVQLEIIPPPQNFSGDSGVSSNQHSPAFSPDTASLVSSLSTLSSLSGDHDGRGNGFDDMIAPPPPGFEDNETVIAPPPQFGNERKAGKFSDKPVESWLCIDVLDWLDSLKLSQYKDSFQQNCIDGKRLVKLTRNNYIELGVTQVAHRMNIERGIKKASYSTPSKDIIASEHL